MQDEEFIFAGELLDAAEHRVLLEISESLDMKTSQVWENLKIMWVSRESTSVLGVSDRLEENFWPPIITHQREKGVVVVEEEEKKKQGVWESGTRGLL